MSKNPILNALGAVAYIILIDSIINLLSHTLKNKPDNTFFDPIVFLSLLTLSVTVMAYMFFYQPLQFFIAGKKKQAIDLFVKTVGVFAVFTAVGLVLLLSRVI